MSPALSLCLMGASTDTGNLGVSALCLSVLRGLARRVPDACVTVFDNGAGPGEQTEELDGRTFRFRRNGLNDSRRLYRRDSLWNVRMSSRFGGAGNPAARALRDADAVLDITGGDSFTDLYGPKRFWSGVDAKRLALELCGGLVLLPQTYGPFRDDRVRAAAADVVRAAHVAVARDPGSFAVLRELLGGEFDPLRHTCGVDVAFRLGATAPRTVIAPPLPGWLDADRPVPTVGVNVSGLTYLHDLQARSDYGLAADYRTTIHELLARLLVRTDARIVLVPHVLVAPGHFESDRDACHAALAFLGDRADGRVVVAPDLRAAEVKWLVSQMDWFCGTRMHSAIAALSAGVPAAALAYSAKTGGVFETCGVREHVADLRTLGTADAVDVVWRSWEARDEARRTLARTLPGVLETADRQMHDVVAACRTLAARRRDARAAVG